MISPLAKTAVHPKTFSLMVPNFTVFVPEALALESATRCLREYLVAIMPPSVASAPGSTEKNNPDYTVFPPPCEM